jgi:prepilin-type N-terminal cleavage/methylation domain-containing protein
MSQSQLRPRGFTLLEVMVASTLSLLVLTGAVTVGVYLQRRGILEERTMEMQNAGRAARDLLVPALQRAGAGFGKARLNVGSNGAQLDQRYAVWVTTNAPFTGDTTFAAPPAPYTHLISDALEIWDADSTRAIQLRSHIDCGNLVWNGAQVCAFSVPATAPAANSLAVVINPEAQTACVGVVGAARNATTLAFTPGVVGRPLPGGSDCSAPAVATPENAAIYNGGTGGTQTLLMPLTVRAYRVNWRTGRPVLEMDPDGSAGPALFEPLAQDIERIKVRMGVANLEVATGDIRFFPDSDAGVPGLDTCQNSTCWARIPGDAGTAGPNETGARSARDELMRRVRLVELLITARTAQPDVDLVNAGANGATRDAEGNPYDGYKRRHFIQRISPRNFAFAGG